MNPSYFRIRLPQSEAIARLAAWINAPQLQPPTEVSFADVNDLACDESGQWRGSAVYLYHNDGWTVFEDLTGHFSARPASAWLSFAESDDFVFAGYNDAIGYGELIVIEQGQVIREFLFDESDPSLNTNQGQLADHPIEPMETWVQAARFVDDDEFAYSEVGWLWLHEKRT